MKIYIKREGETKSPWGDEDEKDALLAQGQIPFHAFVLPALFYSRYSLRFKWAWETRKHLSETAWTPTTSSRSPSPRSDIPPKQVRNMSQQPISGGRVRKAPESTASRHAVRPCIDAMMYDGCWSLKSGADWPSRLRQRLTHWVKGALRRWICKSLSKEDRGKKRLLDFSSHCLDYVTRRCCIGCINRARNRTVKTRFLD